MAASTLSLFPSPSLKNKSSQKGTLRYGQRSAKEPDFEMVKMSDSTQGIIIAVQETSAPKAQRTFEEPLPRSPTPEQHNLPTIVLSAPPKAHSPAANRPRTPSPPAIQGQSTSRPASPAKTPSRSKPPSPLRQEASPHSHTSSPTLVRKLSNGSTRTGTHSPIMRSMFPRYDPNLPLNRQPYHPLPQNGSDIPSQMYSPSVYSQQKRQSTRPSAPSLVIPIRYGAAPILQEVSSGPTTKILSTPDELLQLWDIANGQNRDGVADVFKVELGCDSLNFGSESISFSSSSQSLYTLSASTTALSISRTHPLNPTPTISICSTTLSTPTATSPLLATLFPTLAELMALDQSSSIAVAHRLNRTDSTLLQSEAISRAQANEASNLVWDSDSGNYYLIHPTLLDNASTTFPLSITPSAQNPEKVVIAAPETSGATPLLELDLGKRELVVHASTVAALPGLYVLDTLFTALLTLLLHLHRASSHPAASGAGSGNKSNEPDVVLPSFPPPPTMLTLASKSSKRPKRSLSTWSKSVFLRRASQSQVQDEDRDLEASRSSPVETEIVTQSSMKGKVENDHDWTFQPLVNADDETLPTATKAVLRTLYWGFQVFVWVLGVGVNLIAAGIVGVGKFVRWA